MVPICIYANEPAHLKANERASSFSLTEVTSAGQSRHQAGRGAVARSPASAGALDVLGRFLVGLEVPQEKRPSAGRP